MQKIIQKNIVAIQIDPLETLNLSTDTSLIVGYELQNRKYEIFVYQPENLSCVNNSIAAKGKFINLGYDNDKFHYTYLSQEISVNLCAVKVVLIRQNPPFDIKYITSLYLLKILKNIAKNVLILNDPEVILNFTEKFSPIYLNADIPETIISSNASDIVSFIKLHQNVVLKPLYEYGGNNVVRINYNNNDDDVIIESNIRNYIQKYKDIGWIIVQKFIPNVINNGDFRIIILDGEILSIMNRKPPEGDFITNLVSGGSAHIANVSEKTRAKCMNLAKDLKKCGVFFAGIDLIDDLIIEINVTSPTAIVTMNKLYTTNFEKVIVDKILEKIEKLTF